MNKVLVNILSNSLGDTIATIPYVSEYQKVNNFDVTFNINDNLIFLFENSYTNIKLVGRKDVVTYDEKIDLEYIFSKSIQGGYAEQLGFENPPYIRPVVSIPELLRPIKNKYICISEFASGPIKQWNNPVGWEKLIQMLKLYGYEIVSK
jgi:autotransporter strand-loop-strand O-heptosyltransferase